MEIFGFTPVNSTHIQAKTKKNEFSCASLVEINILYMGGLGGEAPQEKIAILDNIISKFC